MRFALSHNDQEPETDVRYIFLPCLLNKERCEFSTKKLNDFHEKITQLCVEKMHIPHASDSAQAKPSNSLVSKSFCVEKIRQHILYENNSPLLVEGVFTRKLPRHLSNHEIILAHCALLPL